MDLIKTIKHAEAQARQVIEQAKAQAAEQAEKARQDSLAAQAEAEDQRNKAIEDSVSAAQTQGLAEVQELKAQAGNDRQQLSDKAKTRIPAAAAKVTDYLRG